MINLQQEIESQAKEYASTGLDANAIFQKLEKAYNIVKDYSGDPSNGISTEIVSEIVRKAVNAVAPPVASTTPAGPAEPSSLSAASAQPIAVAQGTDEEDEEESEPTSEKELIQTVQKWVAEDVDNPDSMSAQEMVIRLKEMVEYRPPKSPIPNERLADIVKTYAPNAPHKPVTIVHPHPPELTLLINSGIARFKYNRWFVNRCDGCGQFKNTCCGRIRSVSAVRDDGTFTDYGRQAVGLIPIRPPAPPKSQEQIFQEKMTDIQKEPWWYEFRGLTELEGTGDIKMYIENLLPEGVTLLCGLYKEGKSFLALSIAKALTSGKPLFERPGYEVPEIVPVLYLAAESGDRELKMRCRKFEITEDKTLFITRTLSKGPMLRLDDGNLEELVKAMKPVVILETLIRFSDGDEDDASDNRKLAHQIFRLIGLGARAVVVVHHSVKALNKANPTKSEAARGSGDILAMADVIWLAMQDDRLYQGGKGPNEIDMVGWGRDFNPVPIRLALTGKAPKNLAKGALLYAPGIVSYIDTQGNFKWVDRLEQRLELSQIVEGLIAGEPSITREKLVEETGATEWEIRTTLKRLGYYRSKGGKKGAGPWEKAKK